MRRKILTTSFLTILSIFYAQAQTTTAFRMNYGVALLDIPANAIESQTAGNYVFAGLNANFLPIVGTVTELNADGTINWAKQYSGGLSYQLTDIKKDGSSGYHLCGGSSSSSGIFLRIDNSGNYLDGNKFDLNNADGEYFSRMVKTSDGGYVAAGYTYGFDPDGAGGSPVNDSTSALVVKFDAGGNVLWHHVFRFYSDAGETNPILNDAAFVDVVEVSDGYIFVGNYEVDDVINVNSDGDDLTPSDAIILKTTTGGSITYLKQIDSPSSSSSQDGRALSSISKTAAGLPLISGTDGGGRPTLLMRLNGSGGWAAPTWMQKYGASTFFGIYDPFVPSRFFETNDGNYAVMGMYIQPLSTWSQYLMKINPSSYAPIFTKSYTFGMAVILPQGQQVSDNGYISASTVMAGGGFDYHVIKTDPNGAAPASCAEVNVVPNQNTPTYTWADPFYNNYNANAYDNSTITPAITPITPSSSVQCLTVVGPCSTPAAPVAAASTQPTCASPTGSVTLTGLPSTGTWTVAGTPSGSASGTGTSTTVNGLAPGSYTFTVTQGTCTSAASNTVIINAVSGAPTSPVIGTTTQTSCTVSTGSVALSGLPATGTWTVTASPGGQTITGSGTTATFTNLAAGTYTFTVSSSGGGGGPVTVYSENFDGNGGSGSTWNTLNSAVGAQGNNANLWYVSDQEAGLAAGTCGAAGGGDQSLHVGSSTAGDIGAAYDAGGLCFFGLCTNTNKRSFSNNINTTGLSNLTISFNYIENGEGSQDNAYAEYSTNGGTTWTTLIDLTKTTVCASSQGLWTNYSTTLPPACENISNLRIGFRWINDDDGVGTDPSFAVDDITITTPGGGGSCTSTPSASVTINTQPVTPSAPIVGTLTQPSCSTSTGSVALSGLPASGSWLVTASPGGATSTGTGTTTNFTGLAAGTNYTFTVGNGACTSVASVVTNINPAPTVPSAPVVGTITQPTCSTATGTVALSGLPASGSWTVTASPGGATSTGTGTTTTFSGLTSGVYTFTVSNGSCSSTASSNATINSAPTVPSAPILGVVTQPTCATPTGSVALSGLPSTGAWTVNGSPSGSATGTGTTGTVTGLSPGATYTFTVSNGTCSSTASSTATINAVPGAPTAPVIGTITQPTCSTPTGSITLSGLPSSGTWTITGSPSGSVSGTGTSTTLSGLAAGSYTFTVSNDLGCSSAPSSAGIVNAQPTTPSAPVVGTVTQPDCTTPTGSVVLSGLPSTGTWTITGSPSGSSSGSGITTTITGLTPGSSYSFTVTNTSNCTSVASSATGNINAAPTVPSTPILGAVTQPTCATPTGSVALSGLPAAGTWTVSGSPSGSATGTGTTGTVTGLMPGATYTFTVSNGTCSSTASSTATINAVPGAPTAPVIGTITQPTCSTPTGSITLSGLPSSGTWTITGSPSGSASGTGTSTTLSGLAAGSYTFTVSNDLGCSSAPSSAGVVNAQPTTPSVPVVGTVTQPDCATPTGSVVLSGLPASGSWTITGTPVVSASGTGASTTISGLTAGATYIFTVSNGLCASSASTNVVLNAAPTAPAAPIVGSVIQPTCTAPTASVSLSGLPTGSWTITASNGATLNGNTSTATFSGLAPGNTYTFTVTNNQACTSSASSGVVVNVVPGAPAAPSSGIVTQPTCTIPTGSFDVTSPLGAQYTYSIDGTNFQTSPSFTGLDPGAYTVTVIDNGSGCSTIASTPTVVNAISGVPVITLISSSDVTCNGDADGSIVVNVAGGTAPYTLSWSPNAGTGLSLSGLSGGNYSISATDENGCSDTETFTITEPAAIAINGSVTDVICGTNDGSISTSTTGGTAPYSYAWTPNGEASSVLTGLAGGNYGVTVNDANGCTATNSFTVDITGVLGVNVNPSYSEVSEGETVQLTATGGGSYTWTPATGLSCTDCPNPVATATQNIVYYVTSTDDNGCTGSDSAVVVLKLPCGEIYVPTAFSPNGKGSDANNELCVFGTPPCVKELLFQVYDRWGEKIFETSDIMMCWDGKYKGKDMNSGIYVYRLYVKLTSGEEIDTSGNTTLVR